MNALRAPRRNKLLIAFIGFFRARRRDKAGAAAAAGIAIECELADGKNRAANILEGAVHFTRFILEDAEILTIKSDDVMGRAKAYEAIVKGENLPKPGIPEAMNVLLHELRGLALSVKLE